MRSCVKKKKVIKNALKSSILQRIPKYFFPFRFIFSFHHAIEDGWSFATFINELGQAYVNNKPIETKLELRYGEFVQNELAAINNQDTIAFWKEYLKDLNITKVNWKFDKEKAENRIYNSLFILNNKQVSKIHKISRDLKTAPTLTKGGRGRPHLVLVLKSSLVYFIKCTSNHFMN